MYTRGDFRAAREVIYRVAAGYEVRRAVVREEIMAFFQDLMAEGDQDACALWTESRDRGQRLTPEEVLLWLDDYRYKVCFSRNQRERRGLRMKMKSRGEW